MSQPVFIDTHAHLYVKQFKSDIESVIEKAKTEGVKQILLPNIDIESCDDLLALWKSDTDYFKPMMGIHPCSVNEAYKTDLDKVFACFDKEKMSIVGEIGLDYYWSTEHKQAQIDAFKAQINFAKTNKVPIAVHCRESFDDILNILEQEQDGNLTGVLHCFTGNLEQAQRLINIGFYLGIGGVVTFKNAGLDKTLANINVKHLVLETDAPYLAPMPFRGKRNESAYLRYIATKLADIYDLSIHEIGKVTTANATSLFSL